MTQKKNIQLLLVAGLTAASLGGWLLHLRVHHLFVNPINWIPFFAGVIGVFLLPALFLSKKTLPYAYIVNGMLVIIGTITMAHFIHMHPPKHITLWILISGTIFADIVILWANFFIGKALFELEMFKNIEAVIRKGRFFRYPNMGYWGVHAFALSFVYALGHLLWK